MRNVQRTAVTGVRPKGPDHTGRRQRDTACVVNLSPGGGDGAIQQLLGRRILAEHRPVLDLDIIQAVDHNGRCRQHQRHRCHIAQPALAQRQPRPGGGSAQLEAPAGLARGWFLLHRSNTFPSQARKRSLSLLCEPCDKTEKACAVLFGIGGWCLHCVLPKKPKKRALPHAFLWMFILQSLQLLSGSMPPGAAGRSSGAPQTPAAAARWRRSAAHR